MLFCKSQQFFCRFWIHTFTCSDGEEFPLMWLCACDILLYQNSVDQQMFNVSFLTNECNTSTWDFLASLPFVSHSIGIQEAKSWFVHTPSHLRPRQRQSRTVPILAGNCAYVGPMCPHKEPNWEDILSGCVPKNPHGQINPAPRGEPRILPTHHFKPSHDDTMTRQTFIMLSPKVQPQLAFIKTRQIVVSDGLLYTPISHLQSIHNQQHLPEKTWKQLTLLCNLQRT